MWLSEMVRRGWRVMFPHLLTLVPQSRKFLVRAENKERGRGWGRGGRRERAENLTEAPNTFSTVLPLGRACEHTQVARPRPRDVRGACSFGHWCPGLLSSLPALPAQNSKVFKKIHELLPLTAPHLPRWAVRPVCTSPLSYTPLAPWPEIISIKGNVTPDLFHASSGSCMQCFRLHFHWARPCLCSEFRVSLH